MQRSVAGPRLINNWQILFQALHVKLRAVILPMDALRSGFSLNRPFQSVRSWHAQRAETDKSTTSGLLDSKETPRRYNEKGLKTSDLLREE
jgi:hypothetical protein